MKATFFPLLAAAGFAAAQNLDAIPSCALQCVVKALPDAGCEGVDIECACKGIDKIMASAADCLKDACDPEELKKAQGGAKELCGGEDVPSISESITSSSATGSMSIPESTVTTPSATVTTTPSGTPTGSGTEGPTPTGGDGGSGGGDGGSGDGGSGDGGSGSGSGGGDGGDGDAGGDAARPAIGLAAAALAVLAAL